MLFGPESIRFPIVKDVKNTSRIDAKFVNNPEMSDVQFLVDGRLFFGHRIVLVNASEKFRELLKEATPTGGDSMKIPVPNVRYEIFQVNFEAYCPSLSSCISL